MTEKETMDAHPIGDAMKTTNEMREAFEAFADKEALSLGRDKESGAYLTLRTQTAWLAYQTALTSKEAGDGWKLVPVVPTADMIIAASDGYETGEVIGPASCYRVMIAAAPALPQQVKSEDARDAELLNSGMILLTSTDEHGDIFQTQHRGIDLRAAISAAIDAAISAQD